MKSIRLRQRSYKGGNLMSLFQLTNHHEWDHFLLSKVPLVIESTSCHPDYLFLLRGGQLAQILGKYVPRLNQKGKKRTHNPGKVSLILLIFTHNQGKVSLILPITLRGAHVYLVSIGSCSPPPPRASYSKHLLLSRALLHSLTDIFVQLLLCE